MGSINELMVSDWAMTTHATDRSETPNSSAIDGNETKTMPHAATLVTNATPMAANASHFPS
jgi:hypothetical protein